MFSLSRPHFETMTFDLCRTGSDLFDLLTWCESDKYFTCNSQLGHHFISQQNKSIRSIVLAQKQLTLITLCKKLVETRDQHPRKTITFYLCQTRCDLLVTLTCWDRRRRSHSQWVWTKFKACTCYTSCNVSVVSSLQIEKEKKTCIHAAMLVMAHDEIGDLISLWLLLNKSSLFSLWTFMGI